MTETRAESKKLLDNQHEPDVKSPINNAQDADPGSDDGGEAEGNRRLPSTQGIDPRFHQPTPSPWKRAALILFVIVLFWLGLQMRTALIQDKKPKVVYASRYSKEHKFRPAASPIITETLKDGRVRLRGALPTPDLPPTPTKPVKTREKQAVRAGKVGRKARKNKASKR